MSLAIEWLVSSIEFCTLSKSITNLKKKAKKYKNKTHYVFDVFSLDHTSRSNLNFLFYHFFCSIFQSCDRSRWVFAYTLCTPILCWLSCNTSQRETVISDNRHHCFSLQFRTSKEIVSLPGKPSPLYLFKTCPESNRDYSDTALLHTFLLCFNMFSLVCVKWTRD